MIANAQQQPTTVKIKVTSEGYFVWEWKMNKFVFMMKATFGRKYVIENMIARRTAAGDTIIFEED